MSSRPFTPALLALTFTACGVPVAELGDAEDPSSAIEELKAARAPAAPAPWKIHTSKTQSNPSFKTKFVIANTPEIFAALDIKSRLTGTHLAAFEFVSPDGVVFQRTEVPFSMGSARTYRLWNAMPIAGTWIQQFNMTGTWKVRVILDSETNSRATASFVLQ